MNFVAKTRILNPNRIIRCISMRNELIGATQNALPIRAALKPGRFVTSLRGDRETSQTTNHKAELRQPVAPVASRQTPQIASREANPPRSPRKAVVHLARLRRDIRQPVASPPAGKEGGSRQPVALEGARRSQAYPASNRATAYRHALPRTASLASKPPAPGRRDGKGRPEAGGRTSRQPCQPVASPPAASRSPAAQR